MLHIISRLVSASFAVKKSSQYLISFHSNIKYVLIGKTVNERKVLFLKFMFHKRVFEKIRQKMSFTPNIENKNVENKKVEKSMLHPDLIATLSESTTSIMSSTISTSASRRIVKSSSFGSASDRTLTLRHPGFNPTKPFRLVKRSTQ